MKYFLKYSYYIIIGILFACIISLLVGQPKWELIPIIIINVYIVRLFDDLFDYYADKKSKKRNKQLLKYKQLLWTTTVFCIVYIVLNIVFYGLWGLFSLLILLYVGVQNKHEALKPFFICVASIYYIGAYQEIGSAPIIIYLCSTVILSTGYFIYKKQKRTKKKGGRR